MKKSSDECWVLFREEEEESGAILKAGRMALLDAFHSEVDKLDAHRILQDRMNSIYSSLFIASNASFVSYSNAERPAQRRSWMIMMFSNDLLKDVLCGTFGGSWESLPEMQSSHLKLIEMILGWNITHSFISQFNQGRTVVLALL